MNHPTPLKAYRVINAGTLSQNLLGDNCKKGNGFQSRVCLTNNTLVHRDLCHYGP